ncbi:phosphonopyruvate decarboxylase [Burkholderia pyrrocinia]|nr:phosphonopyruvate decarboxylase [Burkholderia pyrrocinia]
MMTASELLAPLVVHGVDFATGVPCSYLTPLMNHVISTPSFRYVGATNEGEAVSIAAGAWLAGRTPMVLCQNSGLGNLVNPVTSLLHPFRIPLHLMTTWRGRPGQPDEPQHATMGAITHDLLELTGFATETVPAEASAWRHRVAAVSDAGSLWRAFVLPGGVVSGTELDEPAPIAPPVPATLDLLTHGSLPRRVDILTSALALLAPDVAVVATTGKTGRELFTLEDRPSHLYQVGSMGYASAMALGVALNAPNPVVVLDGDGAALMHLGNLATIGALNRGRLIHIVLDNGVHDSTGGQRTVSGSVDFGRVALGCGYGLAAWCDSVEGFESCLLRALHHAGTSLIHVRIAPGSMTNLGRPTVAPHEVALRFRDFLTAVRGASPRSAANHHPGSSYATTGQ